jgi:hypothetical protein
MVVPPSSLAKTKPKSNKNATATREKKEMTAVVYASLRCIVGFSNPNIQRSLI